MNLRFIRNQTLHRATLLLLCALVLFFAFHAKISVYQSAPAKLTPSTASKLWLSGQKMEVKNLPSTTVVLFWIAVLSLFGLYLHREPRLQSAIAAAPARNLRLRHLRRFLRPPPFQP